MRIRVLTFTLPLGAFLGALLLSACGGALAPEDRRSTNGNAPTDDVVPDSGGAPYTPVPPSGGDLPDGSLLPDTSPVPGNPVSPPDVFEGGAAPTPPAPPPLPPLPPLDPPPSGSVSDQLEQLKSEMVGTWRGIATSPWVPPYGVEITFEASGHFKARCSGNCSVFYYSGDVDSVTRVYDLSALEVTTGVVSMVGSIYIWPTSGSWSGDLKNVAMRGGATRMTFDFYKGQYGPIAYDLVRVL